MKTRHIAEVVHNTLRAILFSAGDYTVLPWEDAPDAKRKQAVDWVNFYLQTPEASPTESHASWMGAKLAEGWTLGPERSDEAKTHPHLVPFAELPAVNKAVGYAVCELVGSLTKLSAHYVNIPSANASVEELAPVMEMSYTPPTAPAEPASLEGPSDTADVTPLGEELEDSTLSVDPSSNDGMHQ